MFRETSACPCNSSEALDYQKSKIWSFSFVCAERAVSSCCLWWSSLALPQGVTKADCILKAGAAEDLCWQTGRLPSWLREGLWSLQACASSSQEIRFGYQEMIKDHSAQGVRKIPSAWWEMWLGRRSGRIIFVGLKEDVWFFPVSRN